MYPFQAGDCLVNGEHLPHLGQYAMTCVVPSDVPLYSDWRNIAGAGSMFVRMTFSTTGSSGPSTTYSSYVSGTSYPVNDPYNTGWWSPVLSVRPWPPMWPEGATAVVPEGALPIAQCASTVRTLPQGQVAVDLTSTVTNSVPGATDDDGYWMLEWEAEQLSDGQVSFAERPHHEGRSVTVTLPTSGQPDGGWQAWYVTSRSYASDQVVPTLLESVWDIRETPTWLDFFVVGSVFDGVTRPFNPDRWEGYFEQGTFEHGPGYGYRIDKVQSAGSADVFWRSATVTCPLLIDGLNAGLPNATGPTTIVSPTGPVDPTNCDGDGDGFCDDEEEPPANPGGGGGGGSGGGGGEECGGLSGWSLVNPVEWVKSFACGMLSILDDLFDILVRLFRFLFMPDDIDFGAEVQDLGTLIASKAPVSIIVGIADMFEATVASSFGDSACEGVTVSEYQPEPVGCTPPDAAGWMIGYRLVQVGLLVLTAWGAYTIAREAVPAT